MKRYALVVILLSANCAPLLAQDDSPIDISLAIAGGQLIDGYGGMPLQNAVILISGNRISAVGQVGELAIPANVRVIDSNGMTVLPGLWESHGHLMHIGEGDPAEFPGRFQEEGIVYNDIPGKPDDSDGSFRTSAHEVMAAVANISLLSGVTTFRDTGGPIKPQLALRSDIEAGRIPGPRLFLAGPILRQDDPDAPTAKSDYSIGSVREARQVTEKVIALGVDQIKVYGFWDLDVLKAVVDTAHGSGLGVEADVRHIVAYRTAIEAGVDRLHHVFTADPLSDYSDEDVRLMVRGIKPPASGPMANILRGPYIVPTIEMRRAYVRAINFPELLDHPRIAAQYPEEIYQHLRSTWSSPAAIPWGIGAHRRITAAMGKLRHFIEAGGREQIVAGTDAGAPLNLHSPLTRELRNLYEAGLTPMEVIQSATLRPAQMQGVERDLGTVSPSKLADMIIVDGDPLQDISLLQHKVITVIKDGQIYMVDEPQPL